jgi:hypothetical protein
MRGLHERSVPDAWLSAPLSPSEEVTLRRIALDAVVAHSPEHIRRLASLKLIEGNGRTWKLTPLGRQRYVAMPRPAPLAKGSVAELARILCKCASIDPSVGKRDTVNQSEPLQFSELIEWVCGVEGATIAELTSLEVTEGDVIARLIWPTGRSRVSSYPLVAFSRWRKGNTSGLASHL